MKITCNAFLKNDSLNIVLYKENTKNEWLTCSINQPKIKKKTEKNKQWSTSYRQQKLFIALTVTFIATLHQEIKRENCRTYRKFWDYFST